MTVTILKSGASSKSALDYNINKVIGGVADIADSRNLPSEGFLAIYGTFEKYDTNPAIDLRTRNLVFHAAFNPAENEQDEENVLGFIREYLDTIGYAEQPTVVFRHRDIERRHYHVVCPRVNARGQVIFERANKTNFQCYLTRDIVQSLGPKYGFVLGLGEEKPSEEEQAVSPEVKKAGRMSATAGNVSANAAWLFDRALKFNFATLQDFKDVLFAMGLKTNVMRDRKTDENSIHVKGCDENGKAFTKNIPLEKVVKGGAYSKYLNHQGRNNKESRRDVAEEIRLSSVCDWCFEHTGSAVQFRAMLADFGIDAIFHRAKIEKGAGQKNGRILSVTLVDRKYRSVYSGDRLAAFLDAGRLLRAEKDGRWANVKDRLQPDRERILTKENIAEIDSMIIRAAKEFNGRISGNKSKDKSIKIK